ncbi:hypothetical protein CNMCM5793_008819 [Aspergillus hiratsukae]|uniref:GST C-terminal domain-containing protein n=1 Tax=Aspergillus hiratsukae TaxID=1194566 RepID=A0A8H6P7I3_9EURO|nr:hypothetical protein CNMCM5793_008819 [Aspergillus hiratsukae]KAF7158776.1 hypothetical protein CNMCM6106_005572 [Aspergillus hiratsukae]
MTDQVRIFAFSTTLANTNSPKSTNTPTQTDNSVASRRHSARSSRATHLRIPRTERPLRAIPGVRLSVGAPHQHRAHPQGPRRHHPAGSFGSAERDPLYGFTLLKELYLKADLQYEGRYMIPVLWDKQRETIVNNESSEIIRMFYAEFDHLLPEAMREANRPGGGLYPAPLRADIDAMNEWVYDKINNGVYKTGFATTQEAYDENVYPLFEALDRVEEHLGQPGHQPYLFGANITEADIRLHTTIARFDVAYYLIHRCNLRMIRHDYPRIDRWYRRLYYERTRGAFKRTTFFDLYKIGYLKATGKQSNAPFIVPAGPEPDILPLED